jgi:hypothetical protein
MNPTNLIKNSIRGSKERFFNESENNKVNVRENPNFNSTSNLKFSKTSKLLINIIQILKNVKIYV